MTDIFCADDSVYGSPFSIGNKSYIQHHSTIGDNVTIGDNCLIQSNVVIDDNVHIKNSVTIKSNVCICKDTIIESGTCVESGTVFISDRLASSREAGCAKVGRDVIVGANSTIYPVKIDANSIIKPGSVVTRDVPHNSIVAGNPAKIIDYVDTDVANDQKPLSVYGDKKPYISKTGAIVYSIPTFSDMRGDLSVLEFEQFLPFSVQRVFYTYNIDTEMVRGEHAHIECKQFLIAIAGSLNVVCDNGFVREEFVLNTSQKGLYIPPKCWGIQYKHSKDSVLLVCASMAYDSDDYIREYDEFIKYINS
ncbi:WxcM-like domain-containing protein [Maridesulfovibrio sp.]|uniref:WxcM-like domain-containing protein n=1 Tax=Maridesulfovibrio sp. TaxID=2795000 RepID=UPI0029CA25A2|nr:WxcM-like domain-containing protein [Maridesulfovibrio sp.]